MNVLVDTSVWSLVLRRRKAVPDAIAEDLKKLISEFRVKIFGPIRQEILSGIKDEKQFKKLQMDLNAFPDIKTIQQDYELAASMFNTCRAKAIQGSNTDFLICAVAKRLGLMIFTTDRDFVRFEAHLPIILYEVQKSKS